MQAAKLLAAALLDIILDSVPDADEEEAAAPGAAASTDGALLGLLVRLMLCSLQRACAGHDFMPLLQGLTCSTEAHGCSCSLH